MIRKKLLSTKDYISPYDPAVDLDNWEEDKIKEYFESNFELPPLKQGEKALIFKLKQLTGEQKFELESIISQYGLDHPQTYKFLIRYGVEEAQNLEYETEDGEIKPYTIQFENSELGKRMKEESFFELYDFFSQSVREHLTVSIFKISHN